MTSVRYIEYVRILAILLLVAVAGFYSVEYILLGTANELYFLLASGTLVVIALLNLLFTLQTGDASGFRYTLFFFAAMLFIIISNLVMMGIFYITPDAFFNSIFFVGIGLIFYILGLQVESPLLLKPSEEKPRLHVRNLIILVICVSAVVALYYFTAFNPYGDIVSIAVMLCAMILASALAFSLGKSLEDFQLLFKVALAVGFLSLLYSSWVLAVIEIASSDFLSHYVVGIAFILGHFLLHLSPIVRKQSE